MRQVSDIAKKPELASSTASRAKSQLRGMSSVNALALEDQLEHDLAADVGQHQRDEPGERPENRAPPAPAPHVMSGEEPPEDEPREDAEHDLVREGERSSEELLGKE